MFNIKYQTFPHIYLTQLGKDTKREGHKGGVISTVKERRRLNIFSCVKYYGIHDEHLQVALQRHQYQRQFSWIHIQCKWLQYLSQTKMQFLKWQTVSIHTWKWWLEQLEIRCTRKVWICTWSATQRQDRAGKIVPPTNVKRCWFK